MALKKILHVDDDQDIRTITQMSLEMVGGFELQQCASGKEALIVAPQFQPDLLLLDVMMPEMSGEELWHKLMEMPEFLHHHRTHHTHYMHRPYHTHRLSPSLGVQPLRRLSINTVMAGFGPDANAVAERRRWLGPARYSISVEIRSRILGAA